MQVMAASASVIRIVHAQWGWFDKLEQRSLDKLVLPTDLDCHFFNKCCLAPHGFWIWMHHCAFIHSQPSVLLLGTILQEVKLPTKKLDSLTRLMLHWRTLVAQFTEPDEDDENYPSLMISAALSFSRDLCNATEAEMKSMNMKSQSPQNAVEKAALAVHNYGISIGYIASGKALKIMLEQPEKEHAFEGDIMPRHKPVAKALRSQESLKQKASELKDASDFKAVVSNVHEYEGAASILVSPLIDDNAFKDIKESAEAVIESFEASVKKMLVVKEEGITSQLQDFIKKYGKVSEAAVDWKMEAVTSMLQDEKPKTDFEEFHGKLTLWLMYFCFFNLSA